MRSLDSISILLLAVSFHLSIGVCSAQEIVGPMTRVDQGGESLSCADCHGRELEAWKASSHFKLGRLGNDKAKEFVEKLGLSGSPTEIAACTSCHGAQKEDAKTLADGVSCESCHGPATKWLQVHNLDGAGKPFKPEKPDEDADARAKREKASVEAGMIRTSSIFGIARNCMDCHALVYDPIPDDKVTPKTLVAAGHPAGSEAFELVAYSQGEVRHNFLYASTNEEAPHGLEPATRRRALFLSGRFAALDAFMRSLVALESESPPAALVGNYDDVRDVLDEVNSDILENEALGKLLSGLPDADDLDGLRAALSGGSSAALEALARQYATGEGLDAIDDYLPDEFKGSPHEAK